MTTFTFQSARAIQFSANQPVVPALYLPPPPTFRQTSNLPPFTTLLIKSPWEVDPTTPSPTSSVQRLQHSSAAMADELEQWRADVREKITTTIAPWTVSEDDEPPFTHGELVLMALTLSGEAMTQENIADWAVRTFPYYYKVVLEGVWHMDGHALTKFRRGVLDALTDYDVPTQRALVGENMTWWTNVGSAMAILGRTIGCTGEDGSKTFNFTGLPAELRDLIFNMVFGYPKNGLDVMCASGSSDAKFKLASAFSDEILPGMLDNRSRELTIHTRPITEILAPLLVSRQFCREAMPKFYALNRFDCRFPFVLQRMLMMMGPKRSAHITHISLTYSVFSQGRSDLMTAKSVFEALTQITHLRKFDLRLDERIWTEFWEYKDQKKYSSVLGVPNIKSLRKIRGLEDVRFIGCPTLEATYKAIMMKPKQGARNIGKRSIGKKGMKRAAMENEEGSLLAHKTKKTKAVAPE